MKIYGLVFICLLAMTSPIHANWDLATDFSIDNNPNAAWSFGCTDTLGGFTLFPWHGYYDNVPHWSTELGESEGYSYSEPCIWKNAQNISRHNVPPYEVCFHPSNGDRMAVVRWTSPIDGEINLSGAFGEGNIGDVELFITKTDALGTKTLFHIADTYDTQTFYIDTTVAVGDKIDFLVGNAGDWNSDGTPLAVTIIPKSLTISLLGNGCMILIDQIVDQLEKCFIANRQGSTK